MTFTPSKKVCALSLLAFALFFLCYTRASAQVETLTVDPPLPSRITMGETPTVKVKITPVASVPIADVKWSGIEGVLEIQNSTDEGNGVYSFTFKPAKVADAVSVTLKVGNKEQKFTVTVVPLINEATLVLDPPSVEATDKLSVKQQSEAVVRLSLSNGAPIPGEALTVDSDAKDKAIASLSGTSVVINAKSPGTAKVTIFAYGKEAESFTVEVTETVSDIKVPRTKTFTKGDPPVPLSSLEIQIIGRGGTPWTDIGKLNFRSTNPDKVRISSDGTKLEIVDVGEADLEVSAKEDASKLKVIAITVLPKAAKVVLDTGGDSTLIARQKRTVQDEALRTVTNATVKFECQGDNCGAVNIIPKANNSADIVAIREATAVKIVAKVEGKPDVAPAEFLVNIIGADQITDFRPLLIRMDMVDEQTSKDLFGRKAFDEFYVAKVQLFNNLRKTDTEYFGDSILVYSESLQVRVSLAVKCRREDVAPNGNGVPITECRKEGEWIPITEAMVKKYFDEQFSLSPPGRRISETEPKPGPNDPRPCTIKGPSGFIGLYRPYSFDTVAVTHDRRDERSLRSQILRTLNGAISFTSFVTAIAVPGPGSDLPLGLDKSNNLLIPSFEKLFPSMREVQRQNILTMVMRNLEEIPFGGSVERKVFFPKGVLEGLWPGHRVRIAGVSTFDACAEAAIIKKVGQQ